MIDLPDTKKILTAFDQGWLTIWLNSPENRNALSADLVAELATVLTAIQDDRRVRGVTLRGKGGVFCAGGDLKSFMSAMGSPNAKAEFRRLNREGGDLFDQVLNLPQVVIAYVEGAAIAGGLGLMCCSDIIVVSKDAKFALTETQIGIVPAQIAPIVVARAGLPKARELTLTGKRFTGSEAPKFGLANHVVNDAAEFDAIEQDIKSNVLKCAPGANALTKDILLATPHLSREAQKDYAAEKFAEAITSDEGREGIASFVGKRKPNWFPGEGSES